MASNLDSAESFSMKKNNFERNLVKQESWSKSESGFHTTPENNLECAFIKLEPKEEFNECDLSSARYDHSVLNTEHQELHKSIQDIQDPSVKTEPQDGSDTEMLDSEDDLNLPIKFEAGDPEAAGRGVDGGLRGRLKNEDVANLGIDKFRYFCFLFPKQILQHLLVLTCVFVVVCGWD